MWPPALQLEEQDAQSTRPLMKSGDGSRSARDRAAAAACCDGARRHAEEAMVASHAARPLLCALAASSSRPARPLE